MTNVIEIENLYKEYRLGVIGHGTLYKDMQTFYAKLRGRPDPNSLLFSDNTKYIKDKFLALKNINLEVKAGEVMGVIGHNGAGKSTLLKVLSRITGPTSGVIRYNGRIASLLEVGTGFHHELTGRENIYLNGSINGLQLTEIDKKLDEIVDFAGVEKFLDTPVKRYSSGMMVRLGFAVAAYLEPDILVVDEVLAVGDAAFRKKAVDKMQNISGAEGRTVIFVSHNMDSIAQLCTSAILMKEGSILNKSKPKDIVDQYLEENRTKFSEISKILKWNEEQAYGNNVVKLLSISSKEDNGELKSEFDITKNFFIEIEYKVYIKNQLSISLEFIDEKGINLFVAIDDYIQGEWGYQKPKELGLHKAQFTLPKNLFNSGIINININIYQPPNPANNYYVKQNNIFAFKMIDTFNGEGARGSYPFNWGSPLMRPSIECKTKKI